MLFVESNSISPPCPGCGGFLAYRDSRLRIHKKEGGITEHLMIRRMHCVSCGAYHNELPDCIVPFKHYAAEVISGVIDGMINPDDIDCEDYPCQETMRHWRYWFQMNRANIEGALRRAGHSILHLSEAILFTRDSLLELIRYHYSDWLERSLRIIYNSGGYLPSAR